MALRDRLSNVAGAAIPATSAILSPDGRQAAPRIATIATIASPPTVTARQATQAEAAEIRAGMAGLWTRCGWIEHPDYSEALEIALANPDAALDSLRAEGAR